MNKITKIIILIVLIAIVLVGILYLFKMNKKENNVKITILESVWWPNDEDQEIERKEISKDYEVKKGDTITISTNWYDKITLKIVEIKNDYIEVETSEKLSDTGSVLEGKNSFKIEKSKKTTLNTITMDTGATYEIEIK